MIEKSFSCPDCHTDFTVIPEMGYQEGCDPEGFREQFPDIDEWLNNIDTCPNCAGVLESG